MRRKSKSIVRIVAVFSPASADWAQWNAGLAADDKDFDPEPRLEDLQVQ